MARSRCREACCQQSLRWRMECRWRKGWRACRWGKASLRLARGARGARRGTSRRLAREARRARRAMSRSLAREESGSQARVLSVVATFLPTPPPPRRQAALPLLLAMAWRPRQAPRLLPPARQAIQSSPSHDSRTRRTTPTARPAPSLASVMARSAPSTA